MHTSAVPGLAPRSAALRYLACLRLHEILVLQGPPLLGAAFAIRPPLAGHAASFAVLALANLCLVAHVFVINDWANVRADLADPNKSTGVFTANGIDRGEMGAFAVGLLAAALLLCGLLGPTPLLLATGIAACSTLYSAPSFDWKGTPLLSSAAHLAGGTMHFLLGYAIAGQGVDPRGIGIALFFALTFAGGHLTQEIRDHQGDARTGIRTNAVTFGPRCVFAASLAVFTLAHAILLALAVTGLVPGVLAAIALLYPIHVRWSLDALADGLGYASVTRLQGRYRRLYAAAGVAMIAALWLS